MLGDHREGNDCTALKLEKLCFTVAKTMMLVHKTSPPIMTAQGKTTALLTCPAVSETSEPVKAWQQHTQDKCKIYEV